MVVARNQAVLVRSRNRPVAIVKAAMNIVPLPARKATSGVSVHVDGKS
ncbi:MAG: hypothetical protein WDN00_07175 [Limisphaerales bacterium]